MEDVERSIFLDQYDFFPSFFFSFVSYAHQRGTRPRNNPLTFANRILLFDLDEITIRPCVFHGNV